MIPDLLLLVGTMSLVLDEGPQRVCLAGVGVGYIVPSAHRVIDGGAQ